MTRFMGKLVACLCLLGLLSQGGCVSIQPWERELLARPEMSGDDDSFLFGLKEHIYHSKEATFSTGGAGGGGCGCN